MRSTILLTRHHIVAPALGLPDGAAGPQTTAADLARLLDRISTPRQPARKPAQLPAAA